MACLKPAGAWRAVDSSWGDRFGNGEWMSVGTGGTWIGWSRMEAPQSATLSCSIWRWELAGGTTRQEFAVGPPGTPDGFCGRQVAVAPTGAMAWFVSDESRGVALQPNRINGLSSSGEVVTLALSAVSYGGGRLTDLAISADGRTVTWREQGVERAAALP